MICIFLFSAADRFRTIQRESYKPVNDVETSSGEWKLGDPALFRPRTTIQMAQQRHHPSAPSAYYPEITCREPWVGQKHRGLITHVQYDSSRARDCLVQPEPGACYRSHYSEKFVPTSDVARRRSLKRTKSQDVLPLKKAWSGKVGSLLQEHYSHFPVVDS